MTTLREAPETEATCFARKLGGDYWCHLPGLLGANALLLLCGVPALVLAVTGHSGLAVLLLVLLGGPALMGLFGYAATVALDRPARIWRESLQGGRAILGMGWVAFAVLAWTSSRWALATVVASGFALATVAAWAAAAGCCGVLFITGLHALSLAALYRQGPQRALRNALLLTLAHPTPGLGLVAAGVLMVQVTQLLSGGPLIILPVVYAVLAVNTALLLVHRYP